MRDFAKDRILAVDDEVDNLHLLKATLEMLHNAVVETALSCEEGLNCLSTFHPTAIVTDLSMPKADGYVFLHQLRQRPDTAHLPVIALTAHAMNGDRERILTAGFDGYLSKPFNVVALGEELGAYLDQYYAHHPVPEAELQPSPVASSDKP